MERKIGEIFEYNGEWYQCLIGNRCRECDFSSNNITCDIHGTLICTCKGRSDETSVVFKKLEKVGEPYEYFIQGMGIIMVQEYILANANYIWEYNQDVVVMDCQNGKVAIEIKQTKEDMEEKKLNFVEELNALCKRYNMAEGVRADFMAEVKEIIKDENRECKLKPFDLEAAKSGKTVCTRDGRKARIICFDKKKDIYPLIALVTDKDGYETITTYKADGVHPTIPNNDLMILPEKKEGWVNVYPADCMSQKRYQTKEEALSHATSDVIDIVKIEWEE